MTNYRYQHLVRQDCPLPPGTHVVVYCRDSGGEEQDRSVEQQKEALREYCDKHQLILERIYADERRTGSDAERRAELNQLLLDVAARFKQIRNLEKRNKHAAKHPFGLILWKSNRLGRDTIETTHIKSDLRLRGITIVPLVAGIETGDPAMDALFEMFQAAQDEKMLQEQSDNTRRGLSDIVTLRDNDPAFRAVNPDWHTNDGRYLGVMPGPLPTGFKAERILIDLRDRKGVKRGGERHTVQRMIPNHEDQLWERCKLAWQMRHEGAGIKQIMDATRIFKSVSGYDHFFENRIYTGTLVYGGHVLEDFVEAMITQEWFDIEQERRRERAQKVKGQAVDPMHEPRRVGSRHLLSGLVFCGAVEGEEHPMHAETVPARQGRNQRGRWDYYICTQKKNSREQQCTAPRISALALDYSVINSLMERVLTVDNLRPIAKAIADSLNERNADVSKRIAVVQGQIDEVQKSIKQIVDVLEKTGFSTSVAARLRERETEERKLIAELVNLQDLIVKPKDAPKIGEAQLEDWVESIRVALTSGDVELSRQAVRQFVEKIVVNGKSGRIYYTFPLSTQTSVRNLTLTGLEPVSSP